MIRLLVYFMVGLLLLRVVTLTISGQDNARPLYDLPEATVPVLESGSMALADDGRTLVVANMFADTVSIVDGPNGTILSEIPVGRDPRAVVLTPDDTTALVVNRADGTISVVDMSARAVRTVYPVGVLPYTVIANSNQTAIVSLQGSDEIVRLDIATGGVLSRISVPDSPAGLAAWGDFLYVSHLWSGDVSLIYLPQMALVQTARTVSDLSLSPSIAVNPSNGRAYLPQTRNNPDDADATFDNRLFPVVNVLDLGTMTPQHDLRLDLGIVDRPVNMPFAAVVDGYRNWLYVIHAGSDDVSVIDLTGGTVLAHIPVGANPRDALLTWDNTILYVHNVLENSVTVIASYTLAVSSTFPVSNVSIPIDRLLGARWFYTANDPRISREHRVSCANCHFDGQSDGRVWQFPGGGRNTPALFDLTATAPYGWDGSWITLAGVNDHLRDMQAGYGFYDITQTGYPVDLNLLIDYLISMDAPADPPVDDPAQVERGGAVFAELDCGSCHAGATGTDGLQHDVDTGGSFDTPTLSALWLSAPYLHDGRAATLRDLFFLPGSHQLITAVSLDDIDALVAYLQSRR